MEVVDGLTVIEAVVSPFDHKYPGPPVAVNVTLSPSQIVLSEPASAIGLLFTITCTSSVSAHPLLFVTVTV